MEVTNTPTIQFPKVASQKDPINKQTELTTNLKQEDLQEKITKDMLFNKVEGMNDFLEPTSTAVKFQLHEELNEYYIQVIDSKTNEVLKEIPNKKFLDMYASMTEMMGFMVDEQL
ncbi:flagellar protein FlaG [Sporosarcina jiandibaonis]|uniref:flagellar protein FlaG n=1 Tax=Sporosarcina jiandibaonis TaxID=2715535 RepID=UPI001554E678|nr:flagellar protein FlaG [Sporosarcina jiandibaonis]